jgi:hypothetical protein
MAIPHMPFGSGELKNDEKRAITPRRVIKIAGHVDLDKLNMFSVRSTNKYGRQGQFLFLIGYCLNKSSPLKLLGKMEPNLAGSIYVRSSIKLLH